MLDECSEKGDIIDFRLPLRGAPFLTRTAKNVFNKFSVRFFVKIVLETQQISRTMTEDGMQEEMQDATIESTLHELEFTR